MKYSYCTGNQYRNQRFIQIANLGDLLLFGHPQTPSGHASKVGLSIGNGGEL
jgi:hypothetical protein